MDEQRNLWLAVILSALVLFIFQIFFVEPPPPPATEQPSEAAAPFGEEDIPRADETSAPVAEAPPPPAESASEPEVRIPIHTARLDGSISLTGARIDDLVLSDYYDRIGEGAENIRLLHRYDQPNRYLAQFGWTARQGESTPLPNMSTRWQAGDSALTQGSVLELTWNNGEGLFFRRQITVDEDFLIQVTDSIENRSAASVRVAPYAQIIRRTTPQTLGFFILHEGPLGVFDGELVDTDLDYDDIRDEGEIRFDNTSGWLGITDKYWLTALLPNPDARFNARFVHRLDNGVDVYRVGYVGVEREIAPGGSVSVTQHLFAGAKEVDLIDRYEEELNIPLFDRAIDWGWFYFLTKPLFLTLAWLHQLVGNLGVAILLVTIVIKLIFFPLANKSYVAMSKLRKLNPKMQEIRERYADDKMRQQQEIMEIYRKEQVNPMAGCLPILIQIPVFFALYKTLFVTIEMRHQPFFGWIQDLSAPDPLTFITLFGLVPWDAPGFLQIGLWPVLMGLTMYLQQKLNPQAPDPVQAKIFMFMPVLFTFILAPFPAGLVIYWTWNNILSILQQWAIMKKMGAA